MCGVVNNAYEKIGVLEKEEQPEIDRNTENKKQLLPAFFTDLVNPVGKLEIHNGRQDDEQEIETTGLVEKIKGEQGKEQYTRKLSLVDKLIEQEEGKKEKEKEPAIEQERILGVVDQGM